MGDCEDCDGLVLGGSTNIERPHTTTPKYQRNSRTPELYMVQRLLGKEDTVIRLSLAASNVNEVFGP